MFDFGEKLFDSGFTELLLFSEIHGGLPELHRFFESVNKRSKKRTQLFFIIGVGKYTKEYKNSPLKLSKNIFKTIGVKTLELPRRRIEGIPQSPFGIDKSGLSEVRTLINSGNKQGVILWLNTRFESYGRDRLPCGVYRIVHKPTGMFYIGGSSQLSTRRHYHFYYLNKETHPNIKLQNLWNDSSEDEFDFEILEKTIEYREAERRIIFEADREKMLNIQLNEFFRREVKIVKKMP
ncbi:hypothetical protein NIES4101_83450 [Calothrix sp. NIES-4101]|nr:hypothetical protein NIES4101_83450 [Calothrix sp. NIES-4101]